MMFQPTSVIFFLSFFTLALIHLLSLALSLYWIYQWLDIPVHMLGGAVVAQGYLFSNRHFFRSSLSYGALPTLAFVLAVGIGLEFFEYATSFNPKDGYLFDTASDLLSDGIGGALGYVLARRLAYLEEDHV